MASTRKPAAKTAAPKKAVVKSAAATMPAVKAPIVVAKPATAPVAIRPVEVKPVAVKPVAVKAPKAPKIKKHKLVRDSFTMPKAEYAALDALKLRSRKLASPAKKGELLRAGVKALTAMSDAAFLAAIKAVSTLKTDRS